jgi:DNA-binding MarR family transcriptional regulator
MNIQRTTNLLGAFALALADQMQQSVTHIAGHAAAAPAALVGIGTYPGQMIDQLSAVLSLSHSGTVRLIDRLAQAMFVERRAGSDGRTVALYLTPDGEQITQHVLAGRQHVLEHALAGLSEIEYLQLTGLLEKLLAQIVQNQQHGDHICRLCDEAVCPAATCPVECASQAKRSPE